MTDPSADDFPNLGSGSCCCDGGDDVKHLAKGDVRATIAECECERSRFTWWTRVARVSIRVRCATPEGGVRVWFLSTRRNEFPLLVPRGEWLRGVSHGICASNRLAGGWCG